MNQKINLKPERIQGLMPVTPERLQAHRASGDWQVDPTPNAISRHFPQPSFKASATFLMKVADHAEKYDRALFATADAGGVTVRLGNAPQSGVTEIDLKLATALNAIA